MATINGTSFNLKTFNISTVHRNRQIQIVGSKNNVIEDYGYDGLSIDISGSEYSQSDYDDVIAEFMKAGEQSLIIMSGWAYRVHSVRLNRTGNPGYAADIYYPYSLSMITRAPYQFSTEAHTHAHTITSNNQEWDDENAVGSLLKNADLEDWNLGAASDPDYWSMGGGSVARSTDSKFGTYAAHCTDGAMVQSIPISNFSSDSAFTTFGAWVKSSYSGTYIAIHIDGSGGEKTYHTGSGNYEWLEVTKQLNPGNNAEFRLYVNWPASGYNAIIDCAVVVEGKSIYGTDHLFVDDIETNGTVDTPVDIEITASATPSTATATISQTEGC